MLLNVSALGIFAHTLSYRGDIFAADLRYNHRMTPVDCKLSAHAPKSWLELNPFRERLWIMDYMCPVQVLAGVDFHVMRGAH